MGLGFRVEASTLGIPLLETTWPGGFGSPPGYGWFSSGD